MQSLKSYSLKIPFLLKKMVTLRLTAVFMTLFIFFMAITAASAQTTYQVQWGDTLFGIAQHFGVTIQEIAQTNNIPNPNMIYAGQILQIYAISTPPPPPPPPPPPDTQTIYIVQTGDTLSQIARRFNTTVATIAAANNIVNINLIVTGQHLIVVGNTGGGAPPNPVPSGFSLGGQSTSLANAERMKYSGMTWIKIQHKWNPGDDPNLLAGVIQDAHNNGFKILLSISGATAYPSPGTIDFGSYVNFVSGVAQLSPDGIEIWNEMNIDFEWPAGEINPTSYVNNMLRPAYGVIKAVNPNIMVISGALAPTGMDDTHKVWSDKRYLEGMVAAGAANYADCIGAHYNAGTTSATTSTGHVGGNHYSWYFQPTMNLYYNTFGGSRQICFTELGYLSPEGFPGLPGSFSWARNTSVAQQAQWLSEATLLASNSGRVKMLIVFNVDFTQYDVNGDPQAGYAMIRPDNSCPACDTLRTVMGVR